MTHNPTDCQRLEAWYESQTEETLRGLFDRFGAVSPRECWHAFFNDCPPPAHEGRCDCLAAPAEAVQGVCTPTLEQFQRWLETQAHTANQDLSMGFINETQEQENERCRLLALHIAGCRVATAMLMTFKDQA